MKDNRNIDLSAEKEYENLKQITNNSPRVSQSKYYWAVEPKVSDFDNYVYEVIAEKLILEIGCSNGEKSIKYSEYATHVTGVDISNVAIDIATGRFNKKCHFICCDAHNLPFDDNSFDVVVVNGILHHLILSTALNEINRVLKSDGILCAREPLGTNPLIQLYRSLTPKARTIDERPFTRDDMDLLYNQFTPVRVIYFGFISIISAFFGNRSIRNITIYIDNRLSKTFFRDYFWQFAGIFKVKK